MTTSCPDCGAPLTGSPSCPSCGLRLVGPLAARLWAVDQRLVSLRGESAALERERTALLEHLRNEPEATAPVALVPPRESNPKQVQNTLLSLGALLLALAGIVFTAVTYNSLGVVGRALVLIGLTTAAGAGATVLLRRSLTASAEAVGTVAVVLALLTTGAARRAGLAEDVALESWAAVATALVAAGLGAWARWVPLHVSRWSAAVLAQLPVPLALARAESPEWVWALALTAVAAADLLVADRPQLPLDLRRLLAALAGVHAVVAVVVSAAVVPDGDRSAAVGLVAVALLAAAVSTRHLQDPLAATAVVLAAAAAWAAVRPSVSEAQEPLVPVAVALLALQVAALLPMARRPGAVLGALAVVAAGVVAVLEPVAIGLGGPFTWLDAPWSLTDGSARDAVSSTGEGWPGSIATLVVLLAAAGAVAAAGALLGQLSAGLSPAGGTVVLVVALLPLGLDTGWTTGLVLLLVAGAALSGGALALPEPWRQAAVPAGFSVAAFAGVWSVAGRDATLAVLPVVALLAAVLSTRVATMVAAAVLVGGAELAAVGVDQGLARDQVGGLLLLAPAAAVGLSYLLRERFRLPLEVAAAVLAATSVVLAAVHPGWLSWTLALSGLLALAVALRPDRRPVALAGGLLLSASSWVRLADADVTAPEPYVAPLAAIALLLGHLRRRSDPATGSWSAYGAGLALALVPSLLQSFADESPTRGLLLLGVAVGVLLVGAQQRLQAPLTAGAVVVVLDGLNLLGPYAAALPRWLVLAAAGALVLGIGATYEQRLREVVRMRERYDALG